ncbi:hypothetical protein [Candidatus Cardinium hertigii]|nr:hypothetical protein [Candidatus Cardinium hertigii]
MHNAHDRGYVDWPSWAIYLYRHPGYKPYQPFTDIKKYGCNWGNWVTFPQKIEAIQARVGYMHNPSALFRSKDFLVIYKHPAYYKQAFLDYLVDKRYTLEQKKIAIYATVRLGSFLCWETYYQLYKKKEIGLSLLELLLAINLSYRFVNPPEKLMKEECVCLERIQNNIPKGSSLYNAIKSILDHQFPKSWYRHRMFCDNQDASHGYYVAPFPFYDMLTDAVRDKKYWQNWHITADSPVGLETYPYFLVVIEHPQYYYPAHFGPFSSAQDGIAILRDKGYTDEEKSMAIFGMSQLGVSSSYESSFYYAWMIEHVIEWYKQGHISVHHLFQLFVCDFPTFYKYPFFIIDYKEAAIQVALNKFIAAPTIPEGLKEIARKVKNGTLATREEMAYMEGYRTFRKTYFTLYETIFPRDA